MDTHFGTFLYQNRCPDMKKVTYFDTRCFGVMELLKNCGIGRFCSTIPNSLSLQSFLDT